MKATATSADGILAVAALQTDDPPHQRLRVAPFSNIRATVAAPEVGIHSARTGGGNTSMTSPHATGIAALCAERQLQRNGVVNSGVLDAQLPGNARRERLTDASFVHVGEGLVLALLD
ncbi:MAG: hypothetical protein ABFS02_02455 [Pseudomonadota bacterium]